MNIDMSKFVLKCKNNDCDEDNEEHKCCVACGQFQECIKKDWSCAHLNHDGSPEDCEDFYFERITTTG